MTDPTGDEWAAEFWSEDPDVEFTAAPLDQNPPHGHNDPKRLNRGDSRLAVPIGRLLAIFRNG